MEVGNEVAYYSPIRDMKQFERRAYPADDGALAISAKDCAVDGARQLKVGEPYK